MAKRGRTARNSNHAEPALARLHEKISPTSTTTILTRSLPLPTAQRPTATANMSEGGDIEVENSALYDVLPKDVVKEVGNVKLFNKWDYDVEVRDISLTYVSRCCG